jgi:hypothetical protein
MYGQFWKSAAVLAVIACSSNEGGGTGTDAGNADAPSSGGTSSSTGGTSGTAGTSSATGGTSSSSGGSGGLPGIGCKVGGVVYPNGASGIKDPFSCNDCTCMEGELACTKIGCPVACPAGSAPGKQCAQCGPVDNCEVVEHACLPTCSAGTCTGAGACVGGVCKNLCG